MSSSEAANRQWIPSRRQPTDFPLIDNDPHLSRVVRYMRPSDYAIGAALAAGSPLALYMVEKNSPSLAGRGGFPRAMRLATGVGLCAGFFASYALSSQRFQGITENSREVEKDMKEMVEKVKKGEPLYGESQLPEHHQHMAARNSRHSAVFIGIMPWFNVVNHNHHGVDTAKYYQQAERELEAERVAKEG